MALDPNPKQEEERRQALLKYVREVQPQSVVQFAEQTHPVVVQAMRQTVLNVVGSLPPQYFDVRISTVAESLAQLMLSIMTTGYMLRSAQFRMELQNSLKQLPAHSSASATAAGAPPVAAAAPAAAPTVAAFSPADYGSSSASTSSSDGAGGGGGAAAAVVAAASGPGAAFLYDGEGSPYAPGVQKKNVEGEVLRWHLARGEVERLPAADYIELLEREVAALRAQSGQSRFPAPGAPAIPGAAFPGAGLGPAAAAGQPPASPPAAPLATTAGGIEVLGPETTPFLSQQQPPQQQLQQSLACVSPLPGFGLAAAAAAVGGGASSASAAAPASMGSGGIPLVVGSPLGLPRNELLDYLHGLQASGGGFKELACSPSSASGQAVKEAMELFVARLMGTADPEALTKLTSEFTSVELSKVLFWLMAVGYTLKSIEARLELEDGMGGPGAGRGSGGGSGGGPGPVGPLGGNGGGNGGGKAGGGGAGKPERKGGFGGLRGLLPGF
ncbi:hypothetical protein GPECTOR_25g383 [Gonium pectorale]|uniref:Uncharacterized protein n=1 Tax=Gonium pectorale TaxID=33097 RepID=A0A150GG31_GONPE|nr:hypothetical protein GPECTOR_25g383 [Gonium pectorale]|eukprot:KXZ48799.1 hypothetical protein GPECTOR_25g383 [Gonium pectorale]